MIYDCFEVPKLKKCDKEGAKIDQNSNFKVLEAFSFDQDLFLIKTVMGHHNLSFSSNFLAL